MWKCAELALAGAFVLAIAGSSPAEAWITSECRTFAAEVRKAKKHRAMAISRHLGIEYCGGSTNQPSKEAAIKVALEVCRRISSRNCSIVWVD